MKDNAFIDTNVLVYAHTDQDLEKQSIAQAIIFNDQTFISTQVLQELANTLHKKFNIEWNDIINVLIESSSNCTLLINSEVIILRACEIASRYQFSFYDSLIISSAVIGGCTVLYSEDLRDGQIIDNKLTIVNPFLKK